MNSPMEKIRTTAAAVVFYLRNILSAIEKCESMNTGDDSTGWHVSATP